MALCPPTLAADLLERAKEVDEILDLLDRATQGRGGLLAFEGAAGIGKSRLLWRPPSRRPASAA